MTLAAAKQKITIVEVNGMTEIDFCKRFEGLFEHSPWVVAAVAPHRPFANRAAFEAALAQSLGAAENELKLALLRAHPVLGGGAAKRGEITKESRSEQSGLGLDRMEADEDRAFVALNKQYLDRFGFPFIIAVRGQRDRQAILAALRHRLEASAEVERETALGEVLKIAGFRLDGLMEDDPPMARLSLSLHVLDTASGGPGAGIAFTLVPVGATEEGAFLAEGVTDSAGRWALGEAGALLPGLYEITFAAGAYQTAQGRDSFYDEIAIRFRMQPDGGHYHIPLILAPFGYSTYRGG